MTFTSELKKKKETTFGSQLAAMLFGKIGNFSIGTYTSGDIPKVKLHHLLTIKNIYICRKSGRNIYIEMKQIYKLRKAQK